jgi:uncharacterized protein (TIGR03118 family)
MQKSLLAFLAAVGLSLVLALPAAAGGGGYAVHRLVSDQSGHASQTDPNLVNGWGLVAGPSTPWWVADEGTDTSTIYGADGTIVPLVVRVAGGPTGTVYNGSSEFVVSHNGDSGPSVFMFAATDGKIRGWNPNVPSASPPSTKAFVVADRSAVDAVYTGLAIGQSDGKNYLYAADFANKRVDVFNGSFDRQHWAGSFRDPGLPDDYSPFGIQTLGDVVFVTYAKQDEEEPDEEVIGRHLGYVDAYATDGSFVARVASRGKLNAPWGVAWAPDDFGEFSGDLLIGNFGNGHINAYRQTATGWQFDGALRKSNGRAVAIEGLWGIGFGNGAAAGPVNTLYFAAGPEDETHGLFGSISAN